MGIEAQQSFYVAPAQTDSAYSIAEDSHYVVLPSNLDFTGLFIFFGGTGSNPSNTRLISDLAASVGMRSINLSYPNDIPASSCRNASNPECFDLFREEVFFGTPMSALVDIDSTQSIHGRIMRLLSYLDATYPDDGWGQFLAGESLNWQQVKLGGHSQGAGHAAFAAKRFEVNRVLMFSGANDFSAFTGEPAPWVSTASATPPENHWSFLHLLDEAVAFEEQYAVMRALGLCENEDTCSVDQTLSPGLCVSQCLYTALPAAPPLTDKYHGATVVDLRTPKDANGDAIFASVWDHMLTVVWFVGIDEIKPESTLSTYPNPANDAFQWSSKDAVHTILLMDQNGRLVKRIPPTQQEVDVSALPSGSYFLLGEHANGRWSKTTVVVLPKEP